ncbi:hypothetical protein D3C86_1789280 [compost metagenome]
MRMRRLSRSTPRSITSAALSGVVRSSWSLNCWRAWLASWPVTLARLSFIRAVLAMLVLMPPGCTQLAETPQSSMSSSWRSDSVKPRTANLVAL